MYRIKTSGKYIVLLRDMGITLSHENTTGVLISDESFKKSMDVKKNARFLIIEKLDDETDVNTIEPVISLNDNDSVMSKTFIAKYEEHTNPDDVFVANDHTDKNVSEQIDIKEQIIKDELTNTPVASDNVTKENVINENSTDEIVKTESNKVSKEKKTKKK